MSSQVKCWVEGCVEFQVSSFMFTSQVDLSNDSLSLHLSRVLSWGSSVDSFRVKLTRQLDPPLLTSDHSDHPLKKKRATWQVVDI